MASFFFEINVIAVMQDQEANIVTRHRGLSLLRANTGESECITLQRCRNKHRHSPGAFVLPVAAPRERKERRNRILEYRKCDCERGATTATAMTTMRPRGKRGGMGLSKTSITGKWDREWSCLYTSGHAKRNAKERIRERGVTKEREKRAS